jgi:TonB-dependent SusC/RagA subfamily outer membrane receptor
MILGASALTAQVGAAPPPPQPVESAAQRDSSSPLDRLVTLELQAVPLRSALHEIASKGNFALEYSSRIVPLEKLVTVRVTKVTVRTALLEALRGTDVEVVATSRGTILLIKRQLPDTGSGTVGGQVVDSLTGRPVNAAAVTVKDSGTDAALGSITNDTGFYWVHGLSAGPHVILVKKIGYMRAERAVVVPIDSAFTRADIFMHATATNLDAVLVTATGPQRRLDLGNDIALLNVDSIAKTEPIESVTQLLENRVPGLEVQHTSGTPGDPSRIRLRGASSVLSSNDPIVIVDGVRIFSAQSDSQSANLARFSGGGLYGQTVVAAPSALDQIDPNSIASIEVFKGPSAATLYGADAANGVIVITTKRGRPGPPRWTMGASRATTFLPGQYPVGVYRFGANIFGNPVLCELGDFSCRADSVVRFQALNDPAYTILGRGNTTQLSLGVSGGADALTYSVTGSTDQATGLLTLPGIESRQFQAQTGTPPPAWMQRPDQLSRWSATSQLMARLNARSDVSLFTSLTHETQQRSDLEGQISMLMGTYVQDSVTFWRGSGASGFQPSNVLLPAFYTRATDDATNFTGGANLNWRPLGWLTASADGGLNVISRSDQILFPQGVIPTDSGGDLSVAHGNTMVTTVNLRATATLPLPLGFRFQLASGANYTKTSNTDLSSEARNLVPGTASLNGAGIVGFSTETANDVTSFGWYLEPTFTHRLVTMTTGLRIDGSSSFGTHVTLPSPKVGVSYVISGEPWFP